MSYRGTEQGHTDTFIHKELGEREREREEEKEEKMRNSNSKQCGRHRDEKNVPREGHRVK